MRVLITGGSGFVGLAIADALLSAGHDTFLLADREPPARLLAAMRRPAPLLLADVTDAGQMREAIGYAAPTYIVHAAALTPSPAQEAALAAATIAVNVGGTATVLTEAARAGVVRVVLTSSVAVYGPVDEGSPELDEDRAPAPATLYGISKHAAEHVASRLADLQGLDLAIARLGPVYGPFEYETGARGLMSPHRQVLLAARAGAPVILPWGLAADWIFSRDVGEAIVSLLTATSLPHRVFNVGAGTLTDLLAFAARLGIPARIAGPGETPTIQHPMIAGRPPMATDRLAAATGWRAAFGGAETAESIRDWEGGHDDESAA